jgi:biopolymer transport protein ExbD
MKYSTKLMLGLFFFLSAPALAEIVTIARAHEVALSDFRAPASMNGIVAFKSCGDCDLLTVRVTPSTRYVLNNKSVRLVEFRTAISKVTSREDETVIVKHHLESDTVTAISITLQAAGTP